MSVGIIIKNYNHLNRSMPNWDTPNGRIVKNKDHYERLMKENNMVSYEEMQNKSSNKKLKEYAISNEARELIKTAKNSVDKKGNIKLGDRTIQAMIDKGIIHKKIPDYMKLPEKVEAGWGLSPEQKKIYSEK